LGHHGAGLFSWGKYLYVVGGMDASGAYRAEVWRGTYSSDGSVGEWKREADLPRALVGAACVASATMAYVVGGECAGGLLDTVYYTLINSDGSLGFSNSTWTASGRPLPAVRADAAPLLLGGRLFLIGGASAAGKEASILSARLWNDGEPGQWYAAPKSVPAPGASFSAAYYRGKIWVAGGGGSSAYSSVPDEEGMPGDWVSAELPGGSASYPALAATGDGLALVGGIAATGYAYAPTRLYAGDSWSSGGASCPVTGPQAVAAGSSLIALEAVDGASPPTVARLAVLNPAAGPPLIAPGSGLIDASKKVRVAAYPGDLVRYTFTTDGSLPGEPSSGSADTAWESGANSLPSTSVDARYAFRAFRANVSASETVYASYKAFPSSLFILIKDSLSPSISAGFTSESLTQTSSNGETSSQTAIWFRITIAKREEIGLAWADADDGPSGLACTARVRLTLFEDVGCSTVVRCSDGSELYRARGGYSLPRSLALGAGSYYLLVEALDEASGGGGFALRVREGE
jgi:Uncharacterized protein conserved in bacteria